MNSLMSDSSNLEKIELEVGAVYPMDKPYSTMRISIRETRFRRSDQTEDQLYEQAETLISNRFANFIKKQSENYLKGSQNI